MTSIDTKPVIRKILIIIINFFITLVFLGLKFTSKTAYSSNCLMPYNNFLMNDPTATFQFQQIHAIDKGAYGNRHLLSLTV